MSSIGLLLILGLLAAAQAGHFFKDGMEYEYHTTVGVGAGTMDHSPHMAGMGVTYKTRIQPSSTNIKFELSDMKQTEYVGPMGNRFTPLYDMKYTPSPYSEPVKFSINLDDKGLFKSVTYDSSSTVAEKNMIKAFVAPFQMNMDHIKQGNQSFKSTEHTLNGDCEVTYTLTPHKVYKTVVHSKDCKNRPIRVIDDWRGHSCKHDEDSTNGISSHASSTFYREKDGDDYKVTKITVQGALIAHMYGSEGVSHLSVVNSTSVLVASRSSPGDLTDGNTQENSLTYEFDDSKYAWNKERDLKATEPYFSSGRYFEEGPAMKAWFLSHLNKQKAIFDTNGKDKETMMQAHKHGIQMLFAGIHGMSYDSIMELAKELMADKSEEGTIKANIFKEVVAAAGTTASALVVKTMIKENMFDNTVDAARALTSVAYHIRRPNEQLVSEFEELLSMDAKLYMKMAIPLAFGNLVKTTCIRAGGHMWAPETEECFQSLGSKWVNYFYDKYKTAQNTEEASLAMATLLNIKGGGTSQVLHDVITGKDGATPDQRVIAMWSAMPELMYKKRIIDTMMPIFACDHQNSEVRMHALTMIMMGHPTSTDLARIVAVIKNAKCYELINYAFALFERYANSIDPCEEHTSGLVKYYLKFMKQFSGYHTNWGFGVSKTYMRQFTQKKYGYSGSTLFATFGGEDSMTPLSVYMGVSSTLHNSYHGELFGVSMRIEGLAKWIIRKFKTRDPATWNTAQLNDILKNQMSIQEKPDQPVRVQMHVSVKGSVVILRTYDNLEGGKLAALVTTLLKRGVKYSFNHQRVLQVGSVLYEQPSAVGLPLAYSSSITTSLNVDGTVERGTNRGMMFRDLTYQLRLFTQGVRYMSVLNPWSKKIFFVSQNRIYRGNMPRRLFIGVNVIKKELKLNIGRPAKDNPFQLLMHSVTMVGGMEPNGKLKSLADHCPMCKDRTIVSNGQKTDRVIFDRTDEKRGYHARAEYFDCEMDVSRRNTFGRGLAAFMPYNKNPKTPINSILMGLRQVRAYFIHFPRAEKCGAMMYYHQSEQHPVTNVEIRLAGATEKTGEMLFFRGRKLTFTLVVVAKGDQERGFEVKASFTTSPGRLQQKLSVQIARAGVDALDIKPLMVCIGYKAEYPPFGDEMMAIDFNSDLTMTGKGILQYGKGKKCSDSETEIKMSSMYSTTQRARDELKEKWYYQECMKQKNSPEWAKRKAGLPISRPCILTAFDATYARKYKYHIQMTKLSDRAKKLLKKIHSLIEVGLLSFLDINLDGLSEDGDVGPYLKVESELHDNDKKADFTIETRLGTKEITDYTMKLPIGKLLRNLKFSSTIPMLMRAGILSTCGATTKHIHTLDNVTYEYEPAKCWTLLSGHCQKMPSYAVFIKKSSGALPMAVKVFIGGHEVEIDANSGAKINGNAISLRNKKEHVHKQNNEEILKLMKWGSTYNVYSYMRLWVTYDGNYVTVVAPPSVKGVHCGLCGNYNRNSWDDMLAKDGETQLKSASEMVENWRWKC